MATAAQETIEQFYEYSNSRAANLSIAEGVIRGVKILGSESRNGRVYPKETMVRAAALYEGAKVNVDHPAGSPNSPRGYRDRIGVIRNVRSGQGEAGLFADFHFNPKHPLAEQLAWDAQHSPENVGFSHNIQAITGHRDGKTVVEEIKRVTSVDLVADPATTRGLFEGDQSTNEESEVETMAETTVTVESLQAEHPKIVDAITKSALATFTESESNKAKEAELASLREEVEKHRAAETARAKREAIEAQLAESKLPAEMITDTLRQTLAEITEERRAALIVDLQAIAKQRSGKPVSKEQTPQQITESELKLDSPKATASFLTGRRA